MKNNLLFLIYFPVSILLFCVINNFGFSQQLIINEVSQGTSGGKEYVELLVIPTNPCHSCIDLRGWIIDDNNGYFSGGPSSGVGIAPGAIRFSNDPFWSCISMGTLITIYNDADINPQIGTPDTIVDDGNCNLIIPISSTLFDRHSSIPNNSSSSYPSTGWTSGGNWWSIGMSNSNDSFLTIAPSNTSIIIHSVSWGNNNVNYIIYFSGSATGKFFSFVNLISDDPFNQLNWASDLCSIGNETPGQPNNNENYFYISSLTNNCTNSNPAPSSSTSNITICDNQLPYSWNSLIFNSSGSQTDTLTNSTGCDSLATLNLFVNLQVTSNTYDTICENQLPYTWNGLTFNATENQSATLISSSGCDSIATLNLTVNPQVIGSNTYDTICENQLPYPWWNGISMSASGTISTSLLTTKGCDSIISLYLTVLATHNWLTGDSTNSIDTSVCNNQLPITINGILFENAGIIIDTLSNMYGCDSIIKHQLTVYDCELIIPTAFTPDNDLVNDHWELINIDLYFPDNLVNIYNRWGELIFESVKGHYLDKPWDGSLKGKPLPVGSYYYLIDVQKEGYENKTGSVSIIR